VEISEKLLCLFSTDVSEEEDRYVIEVPRQEIETGDIDPGEVYRVALISREGEASTDEGTTTATAQSAPSEPQPPVDVGETRYVEIEDIGKQGDGIARVERAATSSSCPARRRRTRQDRSHRGQVELRRRRDHRGHVLRTTFLSGSSHAVGALEPGQKSGRKRPSASGAHGSFLPVRFTEGFAQPSHRSRSGKRRAKRAVQWGLPPFALLSTPIVFRYSSHRFGKRSCRTRIIDRSTGLRLTPRAASHRPVSRLRSRERRSRRGRGRRARSCRGRRWPPRVPERRVP